MTVALPGEIVTLTGAVGACTTATYTVFDTLLSGVRTTTGTEGFGEGALPFAVNTLADPYVVWSVTPSNETVEPGTNPAPFTDNWKLPVLIDVGLTELMVAWGSRVTVAAPLAPGDAVLVARTVTTAGVGNVAGAR